MSKAGTPGAPEALPEAIVEAAIAWAVKLDYDATSSATRSAFDRWLHADPRHALAWQRVDSLKQPFTSVPAGLLRRALEATDRTRSPRVPKRRNTLKLLVLIGLSISVCWVAHEQAPWQRVLADASTRTGEQETLNLSDGTQLVLNTDSAVSTDLAGERRVVVLRRGEVLIATGPDAAMARKRPFWVQTPFGQVQALGTRFTVRLDEGRARISVQEGAVMLHPADGGASPVVPAGASRWLAVDGTESTDLLGMEADGWRDGVIAGQNIRLADLLAELSRYRFGHIACDPRVAELRVSGLFHIEDTDQVLQFLMQTQPIRVTYRTRWWVSVEPAGAASAD